MSQAHEQPRGDKAMRYEIRVREHLDESWSESLGGLTIEHDGDTTVLSGVFADQAALRGTVTRVWNLNLMLISLTCSADFGAR